MEASPIISTSNPKANRLRWPVPNPPLPSKDHQCVLTPPPIPLKIAILSSPSPTHSRNPKISVLDSAISSALPATPPPLVYDKPVYDDDIFDGVPRLKSSAAKAKYEDVFTSVAASSPSK
ncbi:hypothetical protein CFP56_008966 [Quercus suber]|uniref:Uncharacterized protein n=1 Tax=Quercus suber TaxID=58331 RepID=A0AAW0L1Y8_QUESU